MCDDDTEVDSQRYLKASKGITRRQFNQMTAAAALASVSLPTFADDSMSEADVMVSTPDGTADCYFVHPLQGKHAAVIVWPDIFGLRPAYRQMGKRLAQSGYSVLVVNPYYREARSPVVPADTSREETWPVVRGLAGTLSAETTVTDATAFIEFLDSQASVDMHRQMGTSGYCMGGSMTMRTAAAHPDRVGAGASFHGGRLVTDAADSPHKLVPQMQAEYLIAIAENDDEKDPGAKDALRAAFGEANLAAEIEVYEGAMHGWCTIDSPVYHEAQAERAWSRMLAIFDRALA